MKSTAKVNTKNSSLYIAVFLAIGSSNAIAIKYAFNSGWSPFLLGFFRMLSIGIFYGTIIWAAKEKPFGNNKVAINQSVIAAIFKGCSAILYYYALSYIPANRAIIISTFSPIINLFVVHFLLEHEKILLKHIVGVLISFIGINILVLSKYSFITSINSSQNFISGDICMLASVFSIQFMYAFEKKALNSGVTPRQLLNTSNVISIAVFSAFLFFSNEKIADIPLTKNGLTSYLYLISIVGVFLFYYRRWLVSWMQITYINSFSHLGKAIAMAYAALFLGEDISVTSIVSFGIILLGSIIASRKSIHPNQPCSNPSP